MTGPRLAVPPVVYAKRTSRSPPGASSSWTTDAKRLSPARWASVSSSTSSAGPQGVAAFAICADASHAPVTGVDAFVPKP